MNDRTMIKVRCDKELLYIRTISWQKKSPHRFAILRSELQKLEQEPNKRVLTSDCGSFASLRLTKGPDGTQILEIRFTWLQEDGNDKVHGWKEDVRIPYEPFRAFSGAGEDMDGAEWRQLSIPELVTRRYEFRCRKNLHLFWGERDFFSVYAHVIIVDVNLKVVEAQHLLRLLLCAGKAPEYSLNARYDFPRAEGLYNIIIRTEFKA